MSATPRIRLATTADTRRTDREAPPPGRPGPDGSCSRCGGTGEILAGSTSVGGGCVNDHYDTCPRCDGSGRAGAA